MIFGPWTKFYAVPDALMWDNHGTLLRFRTLDFGELSIDSYFSLPTGNAIPRQLFLVGIRLARNI